MERKFVQSVVSLLFIFGLISTASVVPQTEESEHGVADTVVPHAAGNRTTASAKTTTSATVTQTTTKQTEASHSPAVSDTNKALPANEAQHATIELGPDVLEFIGEFEDALTESDNRYITHRSNASNYKTLHLVSKDDKLFEVTLCVKASDPSKDVDVQLSDIVYSNDGPEDIIEIKVGNQMVGNIVTEGVSNYGLGWNVFKRTGPVGNYLSLPDGSHTMTIAARTDEYGVELDVAEFRARNQDPETNLLCGARLVTATPDVQA